MQHDSDDNALAKTPDDLPQADVERMFARLDSTLSQEPRVSRLRTLRSPQRYGLAALPVAAVLLGTCLLWARGDLSDLWTSWRFSLPFLASLAAMVLLGALALRPYHRPAVRKVPAAMAVLFGLVSVFAMALLPEWSHGDGEQTEPNHLACLLMGSGVGLCLVVTLRLLGRGQTFGPLFSGGAAAALGNLMLQMHCESDGVHHHLWGHASVYLLYLGAVGLMWVWKSTRRTAPLS